MADSIDETLKEMAPRIRAELNKLEYPTHILESDDLLQETIIRVWKALKNRDGKLEYINSYVKKVVFSVYINEANRIRKENQLIFSSGGQHRNEYEAAGGRPDLSAPLKEGIMASLSALPKRGRLGSPELPVGSAFKMAVRLV